MLAKQQEETASVHQRLIDAAFDLFLHNDYHKVTTRMLVFKANTSLSMISYYFGDKQKLYEEMVRQQFKAIGQALEQAYSDEKGLDFSLLMSNYLQVHNKNPNFPAFLTKILAYQDGPGYRLLGEILDKKRDLIKKIVSACQEKGLMSKHIDIDVLRVTMMSLTVFPFLIKGVLDSSSTVIPVDKVFKNIALFSGVFLNECTQAKYDDVWLEMK